MSGNKRRQKETIKLIHERNGLLKKKLMKSANVYGYSKSFISYCYLAKPCDFKACLQCPSHILRED